MMEVDVTFTDIGQAAEHDTVGVAEYDSILPFAGRG